MTHRGRLQVRLSSSCTRRLKTQLHRARLLKFFDWGYKHGQKIAADLDYVPMPDAVISVIEKNWNAIKGPDGKPLF